MDRDNNNPKDIQETSSIEELKRKTNFEELKVKLLKQRELLNRIADKSFIEKGTLDSDIVREEYDKFDTLAEELRNKLAEIKNEELSKRAREASEKEKKSYSNSFEEKGDKDKN